MMLGLIRRNRHPTAFRKVVSFLQKQPPSLTTGSSTNIPSHHIFSAGIYAAAFARLAAESALWACPVALRKDFRLFIHVDGVPARFRQNQLAWLRELPGVEVTYGMFGILPGDRIPGKWHQVMVNDVVRHFQAEKHLAFIDADLFIVSDAWWQICHDALADDVYALTAGLRENRNLRIGLECYLPIKTNLFTLNTAAHLSLNQQRFSKDGRALSLLQNEFPSATLTAPNIDSMIASSLRAQAKGLRVIDVDERIDYCHVGGFSHLQVNKFSGFDSAENRPIIEAWLARLRLLSLVIDHFVSRGWGGYVERNYLDKIATARKFVADTPVLNQWIKQVPPTRHELAFKRLLQNRNTL